MRRKADWANREDEAKRKEKEIKYHRQIGLMMEM